jgi:hypothetical protein
VPVRWGPVPDLLFGLWAVLLARHPEGVITLNGQQLRQAGTAVLRAIQRSERRDEPPSATSLRMATMLEDAG